MRIQAALRFHCLRIWLLRFGGRAPTDREPTRHIIFNDRRHCKKHWRDRNVLGVLMDQMPKTLPNIKISAPAAHISSAHAQEMGSHRVEDLLPAHGSEGHLSCCVNP